MVCKISGFESSTNELVKIEIIKFHGMKDFDIQKQLKNKTDGFSWILEIGLAQGGQSQEKLADCYAIIECNFS